MLLGCLFFCFLCDILWLKGDKNMKKEYKVSEFAFDIVETSERLEGFSYGMRNIRTNSSEILDNIDQDTISEFLRCPDTKVKVIKIGENYSVVAHNSVAKESVEVSGLGNHFVALVKIVDRAGKLYDKRKENPNIKTMSPDFIKAVNKQILLYRYGEVAIGEFRTVDFFGREIPVEFDIMHDGGVVSPIQCVRLEKSGNRNVIEKVNSFCDWANEAFKTDENIIYNCAKFHADLVRIHPFRDGNKRTCRLLVNYLLLSHNHPMINIPVEAKDEYLRCLNYANAFSSEAFRNECTEYREYYDKMTKIYGERTDETKYYPLAKFMADYIIPRSNSLIKKMINYDGKDDDKHFKAKQLPEEAEK